MQAHILSHRSWAGENRLCVSEHGLVRLSLGIETVGGAMTPLLRRGSLFPNQQSMIFTTVEDGQEEIIVKVLEGLRPLAQDNKIIGTLNIRKIAPASHGVARVSYPPFFLSIFLLS